MNKYVNKEAGPASTSRMSQVFSRLEASQEVGLMAGYVPGDPDLELCYEIGRTLLLNGADFLEFSLSFSDPVADGPTLQEAHQRTLSRGITKQQVFDLIRKLRMSVNSNQPFVVIEYTNCAIQLGLDYFYGQLAYAGVDSVILIDLPPEESEDFLKIAAHHKVRQTFLVAPTTSIGRIQQIADYAQDWIYMVTLLGTTGSKLNLDERAFTTLKRLQEVTNLPVVAGFGISNKGQVQKMSKAGIQGVVSCSAVVNLIHQHRNKPEFLLSEVAAYIKAMKQATIIQPKLI